MCLLCKFEILFLLQRVQLEDEFDDLMKSASSEIKNAYKQEVESSEGEITDVDVEDENLILEEYNSDDGGDGKNSDDEDDGDNDVHCTKVSSSYQFRKEVKFFVKSSYGEFYLVATFVQFMCVPAFVCLDLFVPYLSCSC